MNVITTVKEMYPKWGGGNFTARTVKIYTNYKG